MNPTDLLLSEVKFESYAREGAVLVLPEGVTREDLVESHKLHSYLKEQASDWYQFTNAYSDVPLLVPQVNSTLFVVTGIDRAKIWNIAHFPPDQSELSRPTVFHYTQDQESGRSWESKNKTRMDWSDEMATNAEGKFPSAIFFRGISIALSHAAWTHGISPIPISYLPVYFVPSVPAYGKRADIERLIQRLRPEFSRSKIHNKEVSGKHLSVSVELAKNEYFPRQFSIQLTCSAKYCSKLFVYVLTYSQHFSQPIL